MTAEDRLQYWDDRKDSMGNWKGSFEDLADYFELLAKVQYERSEKAPNESSAAERQGRAFAFEDAAEMLRWACHYNQPKEVRF